MRYVEVNDSEGDQSWYVMYVSLFLRTPLALCIAVALVTQGGQA